MLLLHAQGEQVISLADEIQVLVVYLGNIFGRPGSGRLSRKVFEQWPWY